MSRVVVQKAGEAIRWRAAQLAGVQAIYFLRLLVLAALLAPEAFGLLAIASIALSTLMRVSDVGMVPALVQHPNATRDQYDAAWTVGLMRAVLVTTALVVTAPLIADLFKQPDATAIIQALALRPTIEALASIQIARLTRDLRFRELAFIFLPGAAVDLGVAVVTAPTLGVWALVAGTLAGSTTLLLLSYAFAPHRPRLHFNWSEIVPLVDFGRWVLAIGVVTLAGTLFTQLAVSRMLGAASLGLFFLAVKLAYLPVDAANSVVGAVAFPLFARLRENTVASAQVLVNVMTGMYLLLLPVYALIFVLMPDLEAVLGSKWAGTTTMVRIMGLGGIVGIVSNVLARYLMGHGEARGAFWIEALNTLATLVALIPGLLLLDVTGAAVAWLVGGVATMVLAVIWLRRRVPGTLDASWRRLGAATVVAVVAASVARWTADGLQGLTALLVGGVSGVVAGALLLWWQNSLFGLKLEEFGMLFWKRSD
jgi:O-antigen/teichoic acid export membrane protein